MAKLIDDLAWAILFILKLVAYFLVGVILVSVPLYTITFIAEWLAGFLNK